jgi:hypothetical protein
MGALVLFFFRHDPEQYACYNTLAYAEVCYKRLVESYTLTTSVSKYLCVLLVSGKAAAKDGDDVLVSQQVLRQDAQPAIVLC